MRAELCTQLPFDFLIGRGDSWLSSLHEAALSFSRAERASVAGWPSQGKDAVAGPRAAQSSAACRGNRACQGIVAKKAEVQ